MIGCRCEGPVKVGENSELMAEDYILGLVVHQDPGGNIDKESGPMES